MLPPRLQARPAPIAGPYRQLLGPVLSIPAAGGAVSPFDNHSRCTPRATNRYCRIRRHRLRFHLRTLRTGFASFLSPKAIVSLLEAVSYQRARGQDDADAVVHGQHRIDVFRRGSTSENGAAPGTSRASGGATTIVIGHTTMFLYHCINTTIIMDIVLTFGRQRRYAGRVAGSHFIILSYMQIKERF
ncbi:hypothetical protein MSAN_02096100 [Mycena sanguinolenta]|uniref:Uncharacterized protein n=1 Tax=Mycena sanguinolenta TaxID=230812 RepID=A0A8H6XFU7_9AGAR|nr:hypothetical protein MSAN_02096100 [Mycena sanguinolenta]